MKVNDVALCGLMVNWETELEPALATNSVYERVRLGYGWVGEVGRLTLPATKIADWERSASGVVAVPFTTCAPPLPVVRYVAPVPSVPSLLMGRATTLLPVGSLVWMYIALEAVRRAGDAAERTAREDQIDACFQSMMTDVEKPR